MRDCRKFCYSRPIPVLPTPAPTEPDPELLEIPLPKYSEQYLTFVALEDTTFTFTMNSLQYSLDDGATWTTLPADTASPTVTAGNKIMWKQTGLIPGTSYPNYGIGAFSATGNFNTSGNIMSLLYGDDFIGQTDLTGKDYVFSNLFSGNINLVSAENLILPATALTIDCYNSMFQGCISLTTAPELPANTLSDACYINMFQGCTSLTTAPSVLPATTLTTACYQYMFQNCTSLTSASELPATTLTDYCYTHMFDGCTSLVTAPVLPATTLAQQCYDSMFYNCTSLTTAPELPATTLVDQCYYNMFVNCTSLNYIKCLATDISANVCTGYWVYNVSSTGTFIKSSEAKWTEGYSGIPYGWTVEEEVENDENGGVDKESELNPGSGTIKPTNPTKP